MSPCISWKAARSTRRRTPTTICRPVEESPALYEHCVRAIRARPALRRARPAADGLGRLERRHEPGRHAGQGRKRLAGFFLCEVLMQFTALARLRGDAAFAERCRRGRNGCARTSSSTAGMAAGIGAPTSTTARRSARPQRRMPDRFDLAELVGALRGRATRTLRARRRWRRWTSAWCAASTG
jgi:hypothetical protein